MPIQKFFIGPQTEGLVDRLKPWAIPAQAFARMRNSYQWRGSVRKRFGAYSMNETQEFEQFFTRLRVKFVNPATGAAIQTTAGGGFGPTVVPGAASSYASLGKMFSVGNNAYTVFQNGNTYATADTVPVGANTGNYNTGTGAFTLTAGPATSDVYYYPATPVMHFGTYKLGAINAEQLIAFDTQFAYTFSYAIGWQRLVNTTVFPQANDSWTGTDSDFFWTTNWRAAAAQDLIFFVTNNVPADAMRYWDGANWNAFGSAATTAITTTAGPVATNYIKTCRVIEPYKGRLLLFNVTETNVGGGDTIYRNRIRFSAINNPVGNTGAGILPWDQDIVGGGNFIEIPIKEAIISVQFIKDRCIVFCEASTWELVDTGNKNQPFIVQQLDSELGVESQNSVIHFDKEVLGFGNVGIHACNGLNVERIDEKIPSKIFEINNANAGPERVAGIRDYYNELVYWVYNSIDADTGANAIYPNQVLVYNYQEDTWAINDDSITAFGNYPLEQDLIWQAIDATWAELDIPWDDPTSQDKFNSTIAGNQEGWTFILKAGLARNAISLQITNLTIAANVITVTAYNHNLPDQSYIYFEDIQDDGGTLADAMNNKIFQIDYVSPVSTDQFTISLDATPTGAYIGGGVITRVSEIDILTKQFNFFYQQAANIAINQIDFYVDKTESGTISVDYFIASSNISMVESSAGVLLGTNILETSPYALVPLEQSQSRFWHTLYPNFFGENIQLRFYLTPEQIIALSEPEDEDEIPFPYNSFSDFQLNAMIFYAQDVNPLGG